MGDTAIFVLIVLALWVWEGWIRIPQGTWVFRHSGGRWRVGGTWNLPGDRETAWLWIPPAFARGKIHLSFGAPVSLAANGVWLHASQSPNPGKRAATTGDLLKWSDIPLVKRGASHLLFEGRRQGSTLPPAVIRRVVSDLAKLQSSKSLELDQWARMAVAPERAIQRLSRIRLLTNPLGCGLTLYSAWLLGIFGLWVAFPWVVRAWPLILVITLFQQLTLANAARRIYSKLLPDRHGDRFGWALGCFLSPVALLRSRDQICAWATEDLHPAALAVALQKDSPEDLHDSLSRIARDLLHPCEPVSSDQDPEVLEVDREHRIRLLKEIKAAHRRRGVHHALEAAKTPKVGDLICPRCLIEYHAGFSMECGDCGTALVANTGEA